MNTKYQKAAQWQSIDKNCLYSKQASSIRCKCLNEKRVKNEEVDEINHQLTEDDGKLVPADQHTTDVTRRNLTDKHLKELENIVKMEVVLGCNEYSLASEQLYPA